MSSRKTNVQPGPLFPGDFTEKPSIARSPLGSATIEALWTAAAARVGLRVTRTRDAYATSDGRGGIAIGQDDLLDDDDAVAQLIFHELCHAMTEGEGALAVPDWGLDNLPEHAGREHACLRFAADLAARFGLRGAMAPTTEYRAYYDALPEQPLGDGADPAIELARAARDRFVRSTWRQPIEEALAQTASLVKMRGDAGAHPSGFPWGAADQTCAGCAWMYRGGRGPAVPRCRQAASAGGDGARMEPATRACARWEAPVDCQTCGACCREAYHSVTVSVRDPVVWKEPALIVRNGHRFEILREGPRCAALAVEPNGASHYACSIYAHRPQPCRDFAANGRHCLDARRRVGLSAGTA